MGSIWHWLNDPNNSPLVGALGLIVSTIGFPLTIWQLLRTKRAADAAKVAANNATLKMNSFSALRECELARTNARSVNDAIAAEDWDSVLVNYQAIARNLNDLLHCNINFDADVKVSLSEGIGIINHNCNVVERLRIDSPEKLTKGKQFTALRKIDPIISKTYFNLERLSS